MYYNIENSISQVVRVYSQTINRQVYYLVEALYLDVNPRNETVTKVHS